MIVGLCYNVVFSVIDNFFVDYVKISFVCICGIEVLLSILSDIYYGIWIFFFM